MKTDAAVVNNSGAVIRRKRSKAQILKMKSRKWAISIFRGLLMLGLCFMIIQPIITRFSTSIMQEKDLYDSTIILLPRNVTLQNFRDAFALLDNAILWTVAHQAPLSVGFSRQEYWSGWS